MNQTFFSYVKYSTIRVCKSIYFKEINKIAKQCLEKLFSRPFQGPYEYELFSIMIHSGSAAGGHYYAYIK